MFHSEACSYLMMDEKFKFLTVFCYFQNFAFFQKSSRFSSIAKKCCHHGRRCFTRKTKVSKLPRLKVTMTGKNDKQKQHSITIVISFFSSCLFLLLNTDIMDALMASVVSYVRDKRSKFVSCSTMIW